MSKSFHRLQGRKVIALDHTFIIVTFWIPMASLMRGGQPSCMADSLCAHSFRLGVARAMADDHYCCTFFSFSNALICDGWSIHGSGGVVATCNMVEVEGREVMDSWSAIARNLPIAHGTNDHSYILLYSRSGSWA